jgi:hypothetical protein
VPLNVIQRQLGHTKAFRRSYLTCLHRDTDGEGVKPARRRDRLEAAIRHDRVDMVGLRSTGPGPCGDQTGNPADTFDYRQETALSVGSSGFFQHAADGFIWDISAQLEPDADRDLFGGETQDQCPTNAAFQAPPCDRTAPETTISKNVKRSDIGKVKFRFASDEAGATFECKLKGPDLKRKLRQFRDCDTPRKYKRLDEGRFKFAVRAIDGAGNVDTTPDKDRFRVVD